MEKTIIYKHKFRRTESSLQQLIFFSYYPEVLFYLVYVLLHKTAIKGTLVHLLWKVFTFLYTFYFYSKVQKDKIHLCAGKML